MPITPKRSPLCATLPHLPAESITGTFTAPPPDLHWHDTIIKIIAPRFGVHASIWVYIFTGADISQSVACNFLTLLLGPHRGTHHNRWLINTFAAQKSGRRRVKFKWDVAVTLACARALVQLSSWKHSLRPHWTGKLVCMRGEPCCGRCIVLCRVKEEGKKKKTGSTFHELLKQQAREGKPLPGPCW